MLKLSKVPWLSMNGKCKRNGNMNICVVLIQTYSMLGSVSTALLENCLITLQKKMSYRFSEYVLCDIIHAKDCIWLRNPSLTLTKFKAFSLSIQYVLKVVYCNFWKPIKSSPIGCIENSYVPQKSSQLQNNLMRKSSEFLTSLKVTWQGGTGKGGDCRSREENLFSPPAFNTCFILWNGVEHIEKKRNATVFVNYKLRIY